MTRPIKFEGTINSAILQKITDLTGEVQEREALAGIHPYGIEFAEYLEEAILLGYEQNLDAEQIRVVQKAFAVAKQSKDFTSTNFYLERKGDEAFEFRGAFKHHNGKTYASSILGCFEGKIETLMVLPIYTDYRTGSEGRVFAVRSSFVYAELKKFHKAKILARDGIIWSDFDKEVSSNFLLLNDLGERYGKFTEMSCLPVIDAAVAVLNNYVHPKNPLVNLFKKYTRKNIPKIEGLLRQLRSAKSAGERTLSVNLIAEIRKLLEGTKINLGNGKIVEEGRLETDNGSAARRLKYVLHLHREGMKTSASAVAVPAPIQKAGDAARARASAAAGNSAIPAAAGAGAGSAVAHPISASAARAFDGRGAGRPFGATQKSGKPGDRNSAEFRNQLAKPAVPVATHAAAVARATASAGESRNPFASKPAPVRTSIIEQEAAEHERRNPLRTVLEAYPLIPASQRVGVLVAQPDTLSGAAASSSVSAGAPAPAVTAAHASAAASSPTATSASPLVAAGAFALKSAPTEVDCVGLNASATAALFSK